MLKNTSTGFLPDRFSVDFESGFGVGLLVRHRLRSRDCMQTIGIANHHRSLGARGFAR